MKSLLEDKPTMENHKKHWDLLDLYPLATAVFDRDMNRFFYVNDKFCEMTGSTGEDLLGTESAVPVFFSEEDKKRFITDLNITGEVKGLKKTFQLVNNDPVHTLVFARLVSNGVEKFVIAVFYDLTESKLNEVQFLKEKNRETIATLAGGIAHEFNNALAGITGSIELLEMELSGNEKVNKYTDTMKSSARRMTEATKQLLAYARGGKYQEEIISLSEFIENTLPVLNRAIKPSVKIEANFSKNSLHVKADSTQIQMIISGVLANASEAINGEGKIAISLREKIIDEEFAKANPDIKPGRYACLTIEDKGVGMDEETKSKIFDPFFTTKFQGRGLGMAAAYGIVKNHDGWIYVDSKPARGTKVSILLPTIKEELITEKPTIEMGSESGTVLVIEDERIILRTSRTMLERLGFHVLEAWTGKMAIEIVENYNGIIDLALLDVNLPDIQGGKIYAEIKNARPNMKVLICSGYEIDGPVQDILDAGAEEFIQKPFTFAALSVAVMDLIERRKNNRFNAPRGAVAIPKPEHITQGQIIDISKGGLSFFCNEGKDLTKEFAKLAISMSTELFYLDEIPCKIVSHSATNAALKKTSKKMTRISLQFRELTQNQTKQLEYFLQNHTTNSI